MGYGADVGGLDNIKVTASLVDNVTKPLRSMFYQTKKMTKGFGNMTKNQIKTNNAMVKLRKEGLLFKKGMTSMMSSLFFFKALKQSMDGLLAPAFETVGIFDLFSTMLQIVFIPIALWVLNNIMMPLFSFFVSLPEPIKLIIGGLVLLVSALAGLAVLVYIVGIFTIATGIMATFGAVLATIGAIISGAFVAISAVIGTVVGVISGALALITAPIALIIIIIALLALAWNKNWFGIRDITANIVAKIKDFISKIPTYFTNLIDDLKSKVSKFEEFGKSIINSIVDGIKNTGHKIWDAITTIPIVGPTIKAAGGLISDTWNALKGLIPGHANGTSFAHGGLSLVGERGPELVNLPRGSQVYSNSQSKGMMGGGTTVNNTINITGSINNSMDVKRIADQISQQVRQDVLKYSTAR